MSKKTVKEGNVIFVRIPMLVDYISDDGELICATPRSVYDDDPEGVYNPMEQRWVKREWIETYE